MIQRSLTYMRQFDRNLWALSIGWFTSALGFAVSIPFISIYFHAELGLSITQIGLFFGAMAVIRSVFQMIGGELADRIERRFLLIDSQFIRAAAFLAMAAAIVYEWGFWAIGISLLINSIFGAIFQPAANAMVSDILAADRRLSGYAIIRTATNLGWACGPAMGGFLADVSYGVLFLISGLLTALSGLILWRLFAPPPTGATPDRFRFSDMAAIGKDRLLLTHCGLIFLLYLVVAQLIAPFSVYAVEMVQLSEHQLGLLYTLNGLIVVVLQVPVTNALAHLRLSRQIALGALIYAMAYTFVGMGDRFEMLLLAIAVVTLGEIIMSPPALALTARLAPEGKSGRYMGFFGFFITSGWSLGPLYGGLLLDVFHDRHLLAWAAIASLAGVSSAGYLAFSRRLPERIDRKAPTT